MSEGRYDTAQICMNGHIINSMSKSHPEHNKEFCDKCGARTITKCPHCNTPIRGHYHEPLGFFPSGTSHRTTSHR